MSNESIPYKDNYKFLDKCRFWENVLLVFVFLFSVAIPIIDAYISHLTTLLLIVGFANMLFIVSYYILNVATDIFIYPSTAFLRRKGFIDNSLGSKLLEKELIGYFSNDNISVGSYKLAVNCFENAFFTYNIAKAMTSYIITKNAVFSLFFMGCAYFGFSNSIVALPILQIFISVLFLTQLIHHLNFTSKLKSLNEKFRFLFERKLEKNDLSHPIFFILDYETILAYNKSPLSNRVFKRLNDSLTIEWEKVKERYDIK
jgi:hypothetical protein